MNPYTTTPPRLTGHRRRMAKNLTPGDQIKASWDGGRWELDGTVERTEYRQETYKGYETTRFWITLTDGTSIVFPHYAFVHVKEDAVAS